ncbi:CmcI family methyltransferase [Bradyrhizobium yuanmingense]|uniref:CmcI family methyltransferase n=1 Tax=Bradyrhizobium yuanmingense TaxID=108015 RepID=UPI0023BA10F1|nr:CmcI family methyltransferase [Bradyrhizobium yuanmingense]MDF0523376.1 CmcI family methyltransferase [Bradyrhizobium yuanmingense]
MKLDTGYKALWEASKNCPSEAGMVGLLDQRGTFDQTSSVVNADYADRFVKPTARGWRSSIDPWGFARSKTAGALAQTYKGLIHIKSPFDLALYSRLIWELQPRTILELGSFQGGSGLWLADQMSILCENRGEVHSFDLHTKRIHENAKHPLLTFHQADLSDVATLDKDLLMRLPHPWLVIDDAHVQVFSIFSYLSQLLVSEDYYVIEDIVLLLSKETLEGLQLVEQSGFLVDTYYTDAFGMNVTCAPNAWFRKS